MLSCVTECSQTHLWLFSIVCVRQVLFKAVNYTTASLPSYRVSIVLQERLLKPTGSSIHLKESYCSICTRRMGKKRSASLRWTSRQVINWLETSRKQQGEETKHVNTSRVMARADLKGLDGETSITVSSGCADLIMILLPE